jgi:hypothetical protein
MSIIKGFVAILEKKIKQLHTNSDDRNLEIFKVSRPHSIQLQSYIEHFLYTLNCPEELLAIAFILVEKFFEYMSRYYYTQITVTLEYAKV